MKKIITIVLCGIAILSLISCSNSPSEEEVRGEQISNEDLLAEEPLDKESLDEEPLEDGETKSKAEDFSMGKADGLVYENKFIGIGCTLESDWSFYSDEQIMELNNYTADIAGEEFEKVMQDAELIYDMFAISSNQLDNINVNLEKVNNTILDNLKVEDVFKKNMSILEETYSNMGYVNVQTELGTISIAGKDFVGLNASGEINGLKMYQKVFAIKCNGYLANITITTYDENTTDSILSRFYFVE